MSGALRGVLALDGPSGTGKTTVARKLASQLGARYLDTGATYRILTLAVLRAGLDPADDAAVARLVRELDIDVGTDPERPRALLDGADVGTEIRGGEVTEAVSAVSAIAEVRRELVDRQRGLIAGILSEGGGVVVEGRDIGTVVAPDAELKVFLTAEAEVRAQRRSGQDSTAGRGTDVNTALAAVDRRDRLDAGRAASPLRAAEDAVELDTSELNISEVLIALGELASRRGLLDGTAEGVAQ